MKKLSIAIPTFNRSSDLKRTLENFIMQILYNKVEDQVEIVVSDNCSTDDTKAIVNQMQVQNPGIINYSRNDKNISWDNIKKVAEIANSEYVWFCGDDDIYFHDSVKRLINILNSNDVDGIYLNQVNTRGYITNIERNEIVNQNKFFSMVQQDPEFISTVVIKKSKINKSIKINTWYHMACLLYLNTDDKFYVTKEPFVYNKPSKRSWVNSPNIINYTIDALKCINDSNVDIDTKNKLNNIYKTQLKRRIIFAKINSSNNIDFIKLKDELISILQNDQLANEILLCCKSSLYCKYLAHKHKHRKIKVPLSQEIVFISGV